MDRRLRALERQHHDTPSDRTVAHQLRLLRKRLARFAAGDHLRLDASRAEDAPEHLVGNWVVTAARTAPLERTYTLVRIGAETHVIDPSEVPVRRAFAEQDIAHGLSAHLLERILVGADEPLLYGGIEVGPCPVPLHYTIRASERETGGDVGRVIARERIRRTSAPDFALAVPSTGSGITVTPKAKHLPLPEPTLVEDDETVDE